MAKALAPDTAPGVTVRSGIWLIIEWSWQVPGTEHVDRRLGQVAGPLGAGHDEGAGPVGDQAAVEQVQRRALQAARPARRRR